MKLISNKKKNRFSSAILGLLAVLMLVAAGCSNNSASTTASQSTPHKTSFKSAILRIGYVGTSKDNIPTGPEGWAIQKNLLQKELKKRGIEKIEFHAFPNGPPLNEAMAAGEIDLGILGDTPAIVAKSNGLKTKLISQSSINNNVWLVTPKNAVKSIEELKGKVVATQLGSYMYRYLIGILKLKGLDKDVKIVNMASSDAQAALDRKDIAAYAFPTNSGPLLKSKGYPVIDEAKSHPELLGSSVTVITEAYIAKNPGLPNVWNDIRKLAIKDIQNNKESFYKFQSAQVGYPVEIMIESLPITNIKTEPLSAEGIKLLNGTKKFLVQEKFAKSDYNLNDWIAK